MFSALPVPQVHTLLTCRMIQHLDRSPENAFRPQTLGQRREFPGSGSLGAGLPTAQPSGSHLNHLEGFLPSVSDSA